MGFNVAIDGPAGAGKSTIAKEAAKRLSFIYVDTGAMYRALALNALETGINLDDKAEVVKNVRGADVRIAYENGEQQVLLNGRNVSPLIREPRVSSAASKISAIQEVRDHLTDLQRGLAASADVLMDGRDIGTLILPNADVKVFLTASAEVRADRRFKELQEKGNDASYEKVLADIITRDKNDMERKVAPLKQADDAILLDTSDMTIEEAVNAILDLVREKRRA